MRYFFCFLFIISFSLVANENLVLNDLKTYSKREVLKNLAPGDRHSIRELLKEVETKYSYVVPWKEINLYLNERELSETQMFELSKLISGVVKQNEVHNSDSGSTYTLIFMFFLVLLFLISRRRESLSKSEVDELGNVESEYFLIVNKKGRIVFSGRPLDKLYSRSGLDRWDEFYSSFVIHVNSPYGSSLIQLRGLKKELFRYFAKDIVLKGKNYRFIKFHQAGTEQKDLDRDSYKETRPV